MGVFAGHDHDNDYVGRLHGFSLGYGRVTGSNTYGEFERGARVITLKQGERELDSWITLGDGLGAALFMMEAKDKPVSLVGLAWPIFWLCSRKTSFTRLYPHA